MAGIPLRKTRLPQRIRKKTPEVDRKMDGREKNREDIETSIRLPGRAFFDLGEGRNEELAPDNPYLLSISVVYDAIEGGSTARTAAENIADELETLFIESYGMPAISNEIALESCRAVADTAITLADLRKVDQWRLEYISLNEDPAGDFVPAGGFG